jgi:predicted DNA-binding protein (UPF0251 family)
MKDKKLKEISLKVKKIIDKPIINLFYSDEGSKKKGSKTWTTLTRTQLETLLIDIIADSVDQGLKYEDKAKIRNVSKRSFYRTLEQARINLIKAIFTIMVAGTLNIIDSPRLSDFNELSQYFSDLIAVNKIENQSEE